jgi:hypothetical protein
VVELDGHTTTVYSADEWRELMRRMKGFNVSRSFEVIGDCLFRRVLSEPDENIGGVVNNDDDTNGGCQCG